MNTTIGGSWTCACGASLPVGAQHECYRGVTPYERLRIDMGRIGVEPPPGATPRERALAAIDTRIRRAKVLSVAAEDPTVEGASVAQFFGALWIVLSQVRADVDAALTEAP